MHSDHSLLTLPKSLSTWLLGCALFLAAIPSVRVSATYSACDIFFIAAVVVGLAERFVFREWAATATLLRVAIAYGVAAALLGTSYLVNEMESLFSPVFPERVAGYIDMVKLPKGASAYFEGARRGQEFPFLILMFNATVMPLAVFAVRVQSPAEFRFLLMAWTAGSLFGAAFAVAFCNGLIPGRWEWSWTYLKRTHGLTPHANMLGMHSLLAFPGLLLLLHEARSRMVAAAALAGMGLAWMAIGYSGSRSSAGGLFILLVVYCVMRAPNRPARYGVLASAVLVGAVGLFLVDILATTLEFRHGSAFLRLLTGSFGSDTARDMINSVAMREAAESPFFGVGYQVLRISHNIYLQLLHAAGVVGLIGYLIVIAVPLVLLSGSVARGPERVMCASLFTAVMTVGLVSWVKSNPSEFSTAIVFALFVYAGVALRNPAGFDPLSGRRL
ncbi:MAG: O-antigen ligase family protein [Gammaproteobacteria bacterium]|nr:O-antigen ligase family protein [Gammaproteobacteria bacterium]